MAAAAAGAVEGGCGSAIWLGSTLALLYSKTSTLSHTVPGTTGLLNAARDLYQTQVEKLKPG